jgi:eukaryotic-like serine/threonine-protein kinase
MQREAALGREKSGVEDWISDREAFVLAYSGHLQQAIRTSRHAADLAGQSDQRGRAALFETGAALWEAFFGKALAAKQSAVAALGISRDRDVEYGAAFAQALSGDSSQAQAVASDLERRFPEDTSVKFTYLPAIRALIALNRGEPSKAIELLQNGESYDLGTPLCSYPGFFGMLYPVYVRGLSYLAGRQGAEAAAEFQKILNHRGIVVSDPIGALAHLQLGRAYLLQGDTAKAKVAYSNFLLLWKDADFDIPVLKQAKLEYAQLSSSERQ